MDVIRERPAELKTIADAEKFAKSESAAKKKIPKSKSKQQRGAEAAKRAEIKRIEDEIDSLQLTLDSLNDEITHENVFSNYELMSKLNV